MPEPMNQEPEKEYSNISLNRNFRAKAANDLPMLVGTASIIEDGKPVTFNVAAWGPNTPTEEGKRPYYSVRFTPENLDPADFAREVSAQRAAKQGSGASRMMPVRNPIEGFELREVGAGVMFERNADEFRGDRHANARTAPPRFWGHVLLDLPSGGATVVDFSLWKREGGRSNGKAFNTFYSGTAAPHDPERAAAARAAKITPPGPEPR